MKKCLVPYLTPNKKLTLTITIYSCKQTFDYIKLLNNKYTGAENERDNEVNYYDKNFTT